MESKTSLSLPKKHIFSTPLLSFPTIHSSDIPSSSKADSVIYFDDFQILFDNARSISSSDFSFEKINDEINIICKKCNINPLLSLPPTIPIISFPPFIKNVFDINNLLNSTFPQNNSFWQTISFFRSSSFPYHSKPNLHISETIISKPDNGHISSLSSDFLISDRSQISSQPHSSESQVDPFYYLSSSHSLFIHNHNFFYKPTFSELGSEIDWVSCILPEIISSPVSNVLPISSNRFYVTDSSQIYMIEIDPRTDEESAIVLKQNAINSNSDQSDAPETLTFHQPPENVFMDIIHDKLVIAKKPNQLIFYDQNLEKSEILTLQNNSSDSLNLSDKNEFYQCYSAFKLIEHENIANFLVGYRNNVIFKLYDQKGQLIRNFIGHSHSIRQFLQLDDNVLASTENSCLFLWDYRDQMPIFAIDFNPLSLTSNIDVIAPSMITNQQKTSSSWDPNQNTALATTLKCSHNESDISTKIDSSHNSNLEKTSNSNENGRIEIGMALSDGRMRFLDIREPKPIKGFSNTVGVINKFVCSNEDQKMAFFCSMPTSYWECSYS